jgi:hypothetical protein
MWREEKKGEALKKASLLQQKRFKKATLDLDENPFCQDRQLVNADPSSPYAFISFIMSSNLSCHPYFIKKSLL